MDTFYEMHTICSFSPLNFDMRNGDGMKVIDKIHHALSLSLWLYTLKGILSMQFT